MPMAGLLSASSQGRLCPVQPEVALNGSTGATLEEIYFNFCRFQTMYSFGVPMVEGVPQDVARQTVVFHRTLPDSADVPS